MQGSRTGVDAYGHARDLLLEARSLLPQACGVLAMSGGTVAPCDATQRAALRRARRCTIFACIMVQSYEKWSPDAARSPRPRESADTWRQVADVFEDIAYLDACLGPAAIAAPEVDVDDVRDACALPAVRGFAELCVFD